MDGDLLHYVIIGNGGAGVKALQTIREFDKKNYITIISKEQYPAYSPCSLPNLLSGEIEKPTIFRFDEGFYKRLNVKFLNNSEVFKIIIKSKEVKLTDETTIKFDKLLIAVGAKPITPKDLKGLNLHGVHVMGTLDSTLGILDHVEKGVNHAVVVGGGFMGIETATMLRKRGIDVSIVEMLPNILSRMLDPDISKKVEKILQDQGIKIILNDVVNSIIGEKKVTSVSLTNKKLPCDMVVIAIGVNPNVEIIKGSGIKSNRGILVDSTMQTNIKNIYAAGDITEVIEQVEGKQGSFAIWPNAIEQGRIAGMNMVEKTITYEGAEVVNVLDVFNIPIVAMGSISHDIGKCEKITRFTPHTSKKILIKNNRILGLQFVGTIRNTGTFYSLMKKGSDVSDIKENLLDDNFIIVPDIASSQIKK